METSNMQRHAHNWAIPTDVFRSCKSLVDFWDVLAVDDGLSQGYVQNGDQSLPEFPIVLQSRHYPINAWLTHPECPFTKFYQDGEETQEQLPTSKLQDSSYHALSTDLP